MIDQIGDRSPEAIKIFSHVLLCHISALTRPTSKSIHGPSRGIHAKTGRHRWRLGRGVYGSCPVVDARRYAGRG
jgi:hypothetical protein